MLVLAVHTHQEQVIHYHFAEVFVNSQLGNPNELGKAMNIWLEKKGMVKQ